MGIKTVAVYSVPDATAFHVRYADEAYCIGPASSNESYLNIKNILGASREARVDGVHPGYGFLSENPQMAQAVLDAGLVWIGPSPNAMEAMSSKTKARKTMKQVGVPVIPGSEEAIADSDLGLEMAKEIGFPVMLKAAFGGGGKGMRLVSHPKDWAVMFESATREAQNAFGNGALYVEQWVEKPRHIEVQIMADAQGHVKVFLERECSVQRKHQKLIEESPSAFVTDDVRNRLMEYAIQAAKSVNYLNAGTVEFLLSADRHIYFMEMNTRLQVEHPVTEMVTGIDLVRLQIDIAMGKRLERDSAFGLGRGWAIEARICAEDPRHHFMPSPGKIAHLQMPGGSFVRTDTALCQGDDLTGNYDSMVAKVVVWGEDRPCAIARLDRALSEWSLKGCRTNALFLRSILQSKGFQAGTYDTGLVERVLQQTSSLEAEETDRHNALIAAAVLQLNENKKKQQQIDHGGTRLLQSRWKWDAEESF